ncbi:MAG TPA: hypothetical protein VLJ39_11430, partial [Tepidisphaeraceae bacterium]|nr:hypothetical protein [Tepidisphaeraceae bacterium]
VSVVAVLAVLLAPGLAGLPTSNLISASAARHYPEFGSHGQMTFFRKSVLQMLKGRYSGFDLKAPGGILLAAALLVIALRPSNVRLVRKEVWATAVVSLILFGMSYAVLFRLYFPNRYTHPLIPVVCVVIGVCWRPTWCALSRRVETLLLPIVALGLPAAMAWIGVAYVNLGPQLSVAGSARLLQGGAGSLVASIFVGAVVCAGVIIWNRRSLPRRPLVVLVCAILSGAVLVGAVVGAAGGRDFILCGQPRLQAYLRSLPDAAVIAGDPVKLDCVPIESERAVVVSRKLYQPVDANYFKVIRPRMFTMLRAYYGTSRRAIANLYLHYGADYLVVQRSLLTAHRALPAYTYMAPFEKLINTRLDATSTRAALRLPTSCAVWNRGELTVYDLRCVTRFIGELPTDRHISRSRSDSTIPAACRKSRSQCRRTRPRPRSPRRWPLSPAAWRTN